MKITISDVKTTMIRRKVEVTDFALIPGWVFDGHQCPVCNWAIRTREDAQVMAVNTEEGVFIVHKNCGGNEA